MERRKRPTIIDVAEVAGVSRGTVSRVLNGQQCVSPSSRAAVEDAIRKTGYRVNLHARSLSTGRSNSVGFLLTEPHQLLFDDPNFARLLRHTAQQLAERDMPTVLLVAGSPEEQQQAERYVAAGHVDGVLLISSRLGSPIIKNLLRDKVPTVACGVPIGYEGRIGYVTADDRLGGFEMTKHLMSKGRSRVAMITGPLDRPGGILRLAGYREALGDAYDESLVANGDYSRESGRTAMLELLERRPDLDAVFAANDLMAVGAMAVLREQGKRIPEDVALGGFDDSGVATSAEIPLTTMRQPYDRIAAEMVRLLFEVMDGKTPTSITLPAILVERQSA